ncbi:MAG: cupin domain-containing protein [Candidatus Dormibacteria bacterium]
MAQREAGELKTIPDYYRPLRRLVTGVDSQGRSSVTSDALTNDTAVADQYVVDDLWSTQLPAATAGAIDLPGAADDDVMVGTVIFRRCTVAPRTNIAFHTTDTVDCLVVVSGSVTLVLETGEVLLCAGDCLVQRNTVHGWRNDREEPCELIGVLASSDG